MFNRPAQGGQPLFSQPQTGMNTGFNNPQQGFSGFNQAPGGFSQAVSGLPQQPSFSNPQQAGGFIQPTGGFPQPQSGFNQPQTPNFQTPAPNPIQAGSMFRPGQPQTMFPQQTGGFPSAQPSLFNQTPAQSGFMQPGQPGAWPQNQQPTQSGFMQNPQLQSGFQANTTPGMNPQPQINNPLFPTQQAGGFPQTGGFPQPGGFPAPSPFQNNIIQPQATQPQATNTLFPGQTGIFPPAQSAFPQPSPGFPQPTATQPQPSSLFPQSGFPQQSTPIVPSMSQPQLNPQSLFNPQVSQPAPAPTNITPTGGPSLFQPASNQSLFPAQPTNQTVTSTPSLFPNAISPHPTQTGPQITPSLFAPKSDADQPQKKMHTDSIFPATVSGPGLFAPTTQAQTAQPSLFPASTLPQTSQPMKSLFPQATQPQSSQPTTSLFPQSSQPPSTAPSLFQPTVSNAPITSTPQPSVSQPPGASLQQLPTRTLDESKKALLSRRRIDDVFKEWNNEIENQYKKFKILAQKLVDCETKMYSSQEGIITLNDIVKNLNNSHQGINENIDLMISEQIDLNSALDTIEKQLDSVMSGPGSYGYPRFSREDKDNVYIKTAEICNEMKESESKFLEIVEFINKSQESEDYGLSDDIENILNNLFEALVSIERDVKGLDSKIKNLESDYSKNTDYFNKNN